MIIKLTGLPKVSLNKWYAGNHWAKRKDIKDQYYWIVKSQFKDVLSKDKVYECDYTFTFKTRPLDCSNASAMVKLLEDIIFEDDKWDIITKISIRSQKGTEDSVLININIKN